MSDPENQVDAQDPSSQDETSASTSSTKDEVKSSHGAARRRGVVWGLIVVLIGVALGATVGWGSQVPIYQSRGLIYIEPSMPSPMDPGGCDVLPMFEGFVAAQANLLATNRTAEMAMRTTVWKQTGERTGTDAVERFMDRRRIEHARGMQHIEVQFHDPRPEVALAGVQALIEAYQTLAKEMNDADERLEYARRQVDVLNQKISGTTRQVLALTQDYGGVEAMEVRHLAAVEQVLETEKDLDRIRAEIRKREAADAAPHDSENLRAEEIALESRQMAQYLLELAQLEAEAKLLATKVQEDSPHLAALHMKIGVLRERIERFAEAWNRARAARAEDRTLEELKAAERALVQRLESLRAMSRRVGETRVIVERLKAEQEDLSRKLSQMGALRDQLENQLRGSGRIKIYSHGSLPEEPYQDRRARFALIGGILGGLGALFLVLLFAFVSRRVGRAADANAYHAKVRASIELLPKRIGEWKAHDVGMPPGAAKLARPNVAMGREFQNPSTGENATLRIVQCKDARDLSAYYPPIQFPAQGWTLREAEPRHLPALLAAIPGTVYRFTKESSDGSSEVLVYNFFARPDGSIESGPAGALTAAAETHTQALGAAQFQIVLGPSMTRDRRDEVFRTLIAAALPVMDALCVEDDEA